MIKSTALSVLSYVLGGVLFCLSWNLIADVDSAQSRIITLSPNLTELVFSAGLGDNLVGVSDFSNYPIKAKDLPIISDSNGVNLEFLFSLKPTLILAQQGLISQETINKLEMIGLTVVIINIKTVEELYSTLESLSKISPNPKIAEQTLFQLTTTINKIDEIGKNSTKGVTAFLELSDNPILTTNQNSLIHELLARCQINTLFADELAPWPIVSKESIVAQNPSVILISTPTQLLSANTIIFEDITYFDNATEHTGQKMQSQLTRFYQQYLPNVKLIQLNADIFSRETPRLVSGVLSVCQYLQNTSIN
ncbi:helical backbone metal receptor [Thorsellia anophelis]|uniref:Vitamin B12 transport system substrate-binding protein n=1 Tax=Thorsellia anophelis DSM 18579 TaxID=1123402 RepID=A0A1H9YYU4_9GAMM|nr:helical backbone metal receptor [Thorsellia anophelis]SES73879.1 vitamin B12 transport system substrate-binding protein [Thorsellia anophelis DSM 18579]